MSVVESCFQRVLGIDKVARLGQCQCTFDLDRGGVPTELLCFCEMALGLGQVAAAAGRLGGVKMSGATSWPGDETAIEILSCRLRVVGVEGFFPAMEIGPC